MPLSFQQKLKLSNHLGVVLCRAVDAAGKPLFHYILADVRAVDLMFRDYEVKAKLVDYTSYGQILHSGWGEPTEEDDAIAQSLAKAA